MKKNTKPKAAGKNKPPVPIVPGSEMTLGDDGRWHPVKRAPEPSMIFPTDEENQPKYIDMRSPVADSCEGSTLKVYAEMRRTIETIKSLAGLAVDQSTSRHSALDAVLAIADIATVACKEIQRLLYSEKINILAGQDGERGRELVYEISKKREAHPLLISNQLLQSKAFQKLPIPKVIKEIPLRKFELGAQRDLSLTVDYVMQKFVDYVLHYPQSRERGNRYFGDLGLFRLSDDTRRWLNKPSQRRDLSAWVDAFVLCVKSQGGDEENVATDIRDRWYVELDKKYKAQRDNTTITSKGFESLLRRRTKEKFKPLLGL